MYMIECSYIYLGENYMLLIPILLLSLIPSFAIYCFLKKRKVEDQEYQSLCGFTLKRGLIFCPLFTLLSSAILYVIDRILVMLGCSGVAEAAYYNFMVLALSEELVKYLMLKDVMKKKPYAYSTLDVITLMMIIGLGFGLTESVVYAIGANAGMMIVRGLTAMHCSYGFVMGYFVSKGMKLKEKNYTIIGFILPVIIHGAYDFCLSDTLTGINEDIAIISLVLAVVSIIINIGAIIYLKKSVNKKECTEVIA